MSAGERPNCRKRVYSGARWDMGGHRCLNKAKPGSEFCHLHQPDAEAVAPEQVDAKKPPALSASTRRTFMASLTWEPGDGPVVQPPYHKGPGFITYILAKSTDDGSPVVSVRGFLRKKDGTAGLQSWDATFRAREIVPAEYLEQVLAALEAERGR